jgi:predicted metalloprotease with PDZ domain
MFAGKYFKSVDLDPTGPVPVRLNLIADKAESLDAKPESSPDPQGPGRQADKLYGAHHYDHYDFLVACPTSSAASAWSTTARPKSRRR